MAEGKKAAPSRGTRKQAKKPMTAVQKQAAAKRQRALREREARKEEARLAGELELARDGLAEATTPAARTVENATLYLSIYADWGRGYSYDALSAEHGLGVRRCKQIVHELRGVRLSALAVHDPLFGLRTAEDLVLHWSTAISEYAKLSKSKNEGIALGAMRDRDRAMTQFTSLMQELGLLPKHLGTLRFQRDAIELADTLITVMEERGVSQDVIAAVVESIDMQVRGDRGRLELDLREPAVLGTVAGN